jgi:hypothetical protein
MAKGDKAIKKAARQKRLQAAGLRKAVGRAGNGTAYFDAYGAYGHKSRKDRKEYCDWRLGNSFGPASEVRHIDPALYEGKY